MRIVVSFIMHKHGRGCHRLAQTGLAAFELKPRLFWD